MSVDGRLGKRRCQFVAIRIAERLAAEGETPPHHSAHDVFCHARRIDVGREIHLNHEVGVSESLGRCTTILITPPGDENRTPGFCLAGVRSETPPTQSQRTWPASKLRSELRSGDASVIDTRPSRRF